LSYPSSPPKDWDSTLTGLHQLHKRLYLLFLSNYGVYVHDIDICCVLFCRVTNEGMILMSLFTVLGHIGPMT
jgi:hypothetical protein